jgi:CxxC motif-containing protein (DUF1111 family)
LSDEQNSIRKTGNCNMIGMLMLAAAMAAQDVARGRELFEHDWTPGDAMARGGDGLGPVFNGKSCMGCHHLGGMGGAGPEDDNIEVIVAAPIRAGRGGIAGSYYGRSFGYDDRAGFSARFGEVAPGKAEMEKRAEDLAATIHPGFRDEAAVVLHRFGVDGAPYRAWREKVLRGNGEVAVRSSRRNPTPLFGMGLIDAIPDEVIVAGEKRGRGKWRRLPDGRLGRFGWKAQVVTLREFALGAAAVEMGLSNPFKRQPVDPRTGATTSGLDLDEEDCNDLVAFVRGLPRPVMAPGASQGGREVFLAIGCENCHVERLGAVDGLYSDLLMHVMDEEMADVPDYGTFSGGGKRKAPPASEGEERSWRTPPLWGAADSAPYMHDGRAATLDEAIRLHGGEGTASAAKYRGLDEGDREELLKFLSALKAPGAGGRGE